MGKNSFELMKKLEGIELKAYDCTSNKRTVGVGFNMAQGGASDVWERLGIKADFDEVYNQTAEITEEDGKVLFDEFWTKCKGKAKRRASLLGVDYDGLPEWHKFILADIVYNTGSVSKWTQVFAKSETDEVLLEARRNPKKIMDSRVAKIGYHYGLIEDLDDAKRIGLEYAKYLV